MMVCLLKVTFSNIQLDKIVFILNTIFKKTNATNENVFKVRHYVIIPCPHIIKLN